MKRSLVIALFCLILLFPVVKADLIITPYDTFLMTVLVPPFMFIYIFFAFVINLIIISILYLLFVISEKRDYGKVVKAAIIITLWEFSLVFFRPKLTK